MMLNKRRFGWLGLVILIVIATVAFQNCGKSFQPVTVGATSASSDNSSASSSGSSGTSSGSSGTSSTGSSGSSGGPVDMTPPAAPELWYWHHTYLTNAAAVTSSKAMIDQAVAAGYTGVAFGTPIWVEI